MSFEINFIDREKSALKDAQNEGGSAFAEIIIGDFRESLVLPLGFWSQEDYIKQWLAALASLVDKTANKAGIFTEIYNPATSNYAAMCWALYKEGEKVYIQNFYQPLKDIPINFNYTDLDNLVHDRDTSGELSEWEVDFTDIESWYEHLRSVVSD